MANLVPGVNDLATLYPEIAKQADGWDPGKVTPGSGRKLRWKCLKEHRWESAVNDRTPPRSQGCPVCSGKKVISGFNDLATLYREVADEAIGWDPTTVSSKSGKKLCWKCEHGHIYSARVYSRTLQGTGCPVCTGQKILIGFNDLASTHPDVAAEAFGWDPANVQAKSNRKLSWKCNNDHVYTALISNRTPPISSGCPYCSGLRVQVGINYLESLYPEIAKQAHGWDPKTVGPKATSKREWICSKGHIWKAVVYSRTPPESTGCSICSGREALKGYNDLETTNPDIAQEADGWEPSALTAGSSKKMPWRCSLGHTWEATVQSRTKRLSGCPFCRGKKALVGFNDLATLWPELAREAEGWDPTKITIGSPKKFPWRCDKGHIWEASVANRTNRNSGCPICAVTGFNPAAPAWFYLLERPGEQQIGITNKLDDRLRVHRRNGWLSIEISGPHPGDKVLLVEKQIKKWLLRKVGLVPGTHENWFTTSLEVSSLEQLKEVSGIKTEFF